MFLSEVIKKIEEIQKIVGIECFYGLYDKERKEYINTNNYGLNPLWSYAYNKRSSMQYSYTKTVDEDVVKYLLAHHGQIYFPMHLRGSQLAYVAQFNVADIRKKFQPSQPVEQYHQYTLQEVFGIC